MSTVQPDEITEEVTIGLTCGGNRSDPAGGLYFSAVPRHLRILFQASARSPARFAPFLSAAGHTCSAMLRSLAFARVYSSPVRHPLLRRPVHGRAVSKKLFDRTIMDLI
jgi:hypothetical protein